jgi:hypothetical protein
MRWPDSSRSLVAGRHPFGAPGRFEVALWGAVVGAMVADLAVTQYGLQRGYVEANPVARTALEALGVAGLWLLKAVTICVGLAFRWLIPPRFRFLIPAAIALPWVVAVTASVLTVATTTP